MAAWRAAGRGGRGGAGGSVCGGRGRNPADGGGGQVGGTGRAGAGVTSRSCRPRYFPEPWLGTVANQPTPPRLPPPCFASPPPPPPAREGGSTGCACTTHPHTPRPTDTPSAPCTPPPPDLQPAHDRRSLRPLRAAALAVLPARGGRRQGAGPQPVLHKVHVPKVHCRPGPVGRLLAPRGAGCRSGRARPRRWRRGGRTPRLAWGRPRPPPPLSSFVLR